MSTAKPSVFVPNQHPELYLNDIEPNKLNIIAALIGMNGGFTVTGWDMIVGGGLYDRQGLYQHEALTLMRIDGIISGIELIDRESYVELCAMIEQEHGRINHERTRSKQFIGASDSAANSNSGGRDG